MPWINDNVSNYEDDNWKATVQRRIMELERKVEQLERETQGRRVYGPPPEVQPQRTSYDFEQFCGERNIDLGKVEERASRHFTSDKLEPCKERMTEEEIDALIDDDNKALEKGDS